MKSPGELAVNSEPAEPHFLLEFEDSSSPNRWVKAAALSLLVHLLVGPGLLYVANQPLPTNRPAPVEAPRRVTPLIAPPVELTQKAPNKAPLSKEFNLESMT